MAKIVTITNPLTGQPAQVDQLDHTAQQIDDGLNIARNVSNPNLLDNWYFVNPINQRGQTSYTGSGYSLDRWFIGDIWTVGRAALSINDGYITLQEGLFQRKELKRSKMNGRVLSVSALFADGTLGHGVIHLPDEIVIGTTYTDGVSATYGCMRYISEDILEYRIEASGNQYVAVKLELGTTQTLAHQDADGNWVLNEIPDYGEQLARCQRYFCRMYCKCPPKNSSAVNDNQNGGFISFPVTMRTNPTGSLISKEVSTISLGETTVNGFDVGGADNYSRSFVADFTADL